MLLDTPSITAYLDHCAGQHGPPRRVLVALSGGRDSTVLLHLLAAAGTKSLCAVHINHQLHADAPAWEAHCAALADELGAEFIARTVTVSEQGGSGLEANARDARYAAFADIVTAGDWLMTAHHEDDQAETVLLNLLRGSGPAGVRGVAAARPLGGATLLRPLLPCSGDAIQQYADQHGLSSIADPGNQALRHDRNFLRQNVMPLLRDRWPAAARTISRSATLAAEAEDLLRELAAQDYEHCAAGLALHIPRLLALPPPRQRNLLRFAADQQGLPRPPAARLTALLTDLLPAKADAAPCVSWPGAEARRYRDALYLLPELAAAPDAAPIGWNTADALQLPAGLGELQLAPDAAGGIDAAVARGGLTLRFRQGGETLRPAGLAHHRPLKKLLQDAAVLPWLRNRLPLLYAGENLVAVADLWVADEFFSTSGLAIRWDNKPPLFEPPTPPAALL